MPVTDDVACELARLRAELRAQAARRASDRPSDAHRQSCIRSALDRLHHLSLRIGDPELRFERQRWQTYFGLTHTP